MSRLLSFNRDWPPEYGIVCVWQRKSAHPPNIVILLPLYASPTTYKMTPSVKVPHQQTVHQSAPPRCRWAVCVCCVQMSAAHAQVCVWACLLDQFLRPWRWTGKGTLFLSRHSWEWRTSRMYPTVFPDWNFLERGVWLWTLRRNTVLYHLCDQWHAWRQVGSQVILLVVMTLKLPG